MIEYKIRAYAREDVHAVVEIRSMRGAAENLYGMPSDRLEAGDAYFNALGPDSHNFVAVTVLPDGTEKLIGSVGLEVYGGRRRHCAEISVMVHPDYQGCGVGTALLTAALDIADNWLMLVRVQLEAFAENTKAIALYKKMGFAEEGVKRMAAIRNGVYADLICMARISGAAKAGKANPL